MLELAKYGYGSGQRRWSLVVYCFCVHFKHNQQVGLGNDVEGGIDIGNYKTFRKWVNELQENVTLKNEADRKLWIVSA